MDRFSPYIRLDGALSGGLVLLGDHARNSLPAAYGRLGLPDSVFARHIAYDIGIESLTRGLSARLGAPAVLCGFSRLLIDPNRGEDDPTLIMKLSDGAIIPANHPLGEAEAKARIDSFHRPYHDAVATLIADATRALGRPPLVVSLHSYTPAWKGVPRPWQAGILWDNDPRAALRMIAELERPGDIVVGNNEPYDGALKGDTMYRHCMISGIAHALVEVRQDLIDHDAGVASWVDRLAPVLAAINAEPEMHEYRIHPSRTGPYPPAS